MNVSDLPAINAFLNSVSTLLLILGFINIRKDKKETHRKIMLGAVAVSGLFLITYLIYHYNAGSVPYKRYDWTRTVYFTILIPHIILAAANVPFLIVAIIYAIKGKFDKHKKYVRWVYPSWLFVSFSGVIVYFMLYHLPPTA
ncbi:DUF420 domain-containing protein [candidate division KSB1 bacterium]